MSGSCPYCGAKLNYGIKFCVVCGRPISAQDAGKVGGGMRSGIRPADVTRRLEDLMTAARFKRSKRTTQLDQQIHFVGLNAFSVVLAIALLFCAIKLSLDGGFLQKDNRMVAPINKFLTEVGANKLNFSKPIDKQVKQLKKEESKKKSKKKGSKPEK
jgi:hypothetical protein